MKNRMLICMPSHMVDGKGHTITNCFICKGEVAINPKTFREKIPGDMRPVCGGCAVDFLDSAPEESKFELTDRQEREGWKEIAEELGGMDEMSRRALGMIRENKEKYSAKGEKNGKN